MAELTLGHLEVPPGWELSVEGVLRSPAEVEAPGMLAGRGSTVREGPRPSVIVQRREAPADAASFLAGFLHATASASTGVEVKATDAFVFDDGVEAPCFQVELETTPPVVQLHLCRVDDGWLSHFVLAAADLSAVHKLRAVVAGWRP